MGSQRARAAARRRAPAQPTSLYFALLVLLAAGVGLALVWHQWWMPSLVRVSARVPEVKAPQPAEPVSPPPAPETPAAETPPVGAAPEAVLRPDPAPAAPPPVTARPSPPPPVAESAPRKATARPSPPPPVAESAPRKATPRPEPTAPDPGRSAPGARPTTTAPPSSAARSDAPVKARFDPAPPPTASGPRVIPLIPVGAGASAGARGQLHWESGAGGRLVVSGLPQPPPGRGYQLWLGSMRLGTRMSGGLLIVDAQGAGTLHVAPPRATWAPDLFGVTVERLGGAREPSDELVLIGELTRQTAPAPAKEPGSETRTSSTPAASAPAADTPSAAVDPAVPPGTAAPVTEGVLRIVPVPVERAWLVTQSTLHSLGWDIERADRTEGLLQTEPRNVDFRNLGVYAAGTRHVLHVAVRAVSSSHSSISVRRQVFEEKRILWSKERTILTPRDTAVEQTVLDTIEPLL